jgi:hypothetical protein
VGVRKRGVMLAEKRRLPDERGQGSASLLVVSRSTALNLGVAKDAAAYVVLNAILIAVWFIGSRGYSGRGLHAARDGRAGAGTKRCFALGPPRSGAVGSRGPVLSCYRSEEASRVVSDWRLGSRCRRATGSN